MSRQARDDKRKEPTKDPNSHYWADKIFKHIKVIFAFLVLLICILFICCGELLENELDTVKSIAWMSAGFLFGSTTSK